MAWIISIVLLVSFCGWVKEPFMLYASAIFALAGSLEEIATSIRRNKN